VTHDYGGCSLRIHLADPLAAGWYDHDWDEIAVFRFLRERGVLVPGATVLDLGAHQGVVALMLADKVGEAGRVIAVEAEPHNARVAERNRELNEAENLIVVHAAGAASEGVISFSEGLNGRIGGEAAEGHVDVPAATVDGLAAEHGTPDLVFVDVEGYEGHVLEGAGNTLANGSTSFMVEVHEYLADYGGHPQEIIDCFNGFDLYVGDDESDEFRPLGDALPAGRFYLVAIPATRRDS
jgi:FkbM family methyltransferase